MVKGQSSLEFMFLIVAATVMLLIGLSVVNSQMSVNREAHKNASDLLVLSSLALSGNLSAGSSNPYSPEEPGSGSGEPDLHLDFATSQPYYVNQTSIIQLVAWNYGGSAATLQKLTVQSSSSDLLVTPNESGTAVVGLSYTMTSSITPKKPGTYVITGKALDSAGRVITANGQPLKINATILVLASPYGGGGDDPITALDYSIAYSRSGEKIGYNLSPQGKIKKAYLYYTQASLQEREGNWLAWCNCGNNNRANWQYSEYPQGGRVVMCGCLNYYDAADFATISTTPQYLFNNRATATNATNKSYSCDLSNNATSCTLPVGTVRLSGTVSTTGPSPASDSIATSEIGKNVWYLRQLAAYNAYQSAFNSMDALAASINGNNYCSKNCNGIQNLVDSTESLRNGFLSSNSTSATSCNATANFVKCAPSSFNYPTVAMSLNSSFLGGHISPSRPEVRTVSNITTEVSTD